MANAHLIQKCKDKELYAYGTAYLFERRANSLRWRLRIITFLSLAVPLSMGGIAAAFSKGQLLEIAVTLGGGLSIPLFILTLWSIVFRWEERFSSSIQAMKNNNKLRNKWEKLAICKDTDFEEKVNELLAKDQDQEEQDRDQDISKKDERIMMRASLIRYQKECAICNKIPKSMKEKSICDTCGNL